MLSRYRGREDVLYVKVLNKYIPDYFKPVKGIIHNDAGFVGDSGNHAGLLPPGHLPTARRLLRRGLSAPPASPEPSCPEGPAATDGQQPASWGRQRQKRGKRSR